jgi:hypothetical protein
MHFRSDEIDVSHCANVGYRMSEIRMNKDGYSFVLGGRLPVVKRIPGGAGGSAPALCVGIAHALEVRITTPFRKPFPAAGGSACGPKGLSGGGQPNVACMGSS